MGIARMRSLLSILVSSLTCLLAGCADFEIPASEYDHAPPTKTFSSTAPIARSDIEATFGDPIDSHISSNERINVYKYDQRSFVRGVYILIPLPLTWGWETTEGELYVSYDAEDNLKAYFFPIRKHDRNTTYELLAEPDEPNNQVRLGRYSRPEFRAMWYCRAAHQKHAEGQYRFAIVYRWGSAVYGWRDEELVPGIGKPIVRNQVQAYKWYSLAAQDGHSDAAKALPYLVRDMTLSEIAEAERLVEKWQPNPAECEVISRAEAGSTEPD